MKRPQENQGELVGEIQTKPSRRTIIILVILGMALIWGFLFVRSPLYLVLDMMLNPDPFDDRAFNRNVWLKHDEDSGMSNPRGRMAYSLRDYLLENDFDRDEVIDLLGPPEIDSGYHEIQYLLGAWSGIRLDYDFLVITFDEADHVEQVRIIGN